MRHNDEERPPSSLRGRLCDVFFPALASESIEPLLMRLGPKATLDDPLFGACSGVDDLRARLKQWATWLGEHAATFERTQTTIGADRDVTQGLMEMRSDGDHITLPVAVLMERLREREVVLRVYFGTRRLGTSAKGPSLQRAETPPVLPDVIVEHLDAIGAGTVQRIVAGTEEDAVLRDAAGQEHPREQIGALLGAVELEPAGVADDGRVCAVEATGKAGGPAWLLVFVRGDSGLVRAIRVYSDLPG